VNFVPAPNKYFLRNNFFHGSSNERSGFKARSSKIITGKPELKGELCQTTKAAQKKRNHFPRMNQFNSIPAAARLVAALL
jgi:hypothetical protein